MWAVQAMRSAFLPAVFGTAGGNEAHRISGPDFEEANKYGDGNCAPFRASVLRDFRQADTADDIGPGPRPIDSPNLA
jgi:hypothetical protein